MGAGLSSDDGAVDGVKKGAAAVAVLGAGGGGDWSTGEHVVKAMVGAGAGAVEDEGKDPSTAIDVDGDEDGSTRGIKMPGEELNDEDDEDGFFVVTVLMAAGHLLTAETLPGRMDGTFKLWGSQSVSRYFILTHLLPFVWDRALGLNDFLPYSSCFLSTVDTRTTPTSASSSSTPGSSTSRRWSSPN